MDRLTDTKRGKKVMEYIKTDKAPKAVGPYSQGVAVGGDKKLIFTSGQLPIDPATGELITDSIEKATLQSLKNNLAVIEKAGGSKETILKVNIFLKDVENFQRVNSVYEEFFGDIKPARSCVEVARIPKDAPIEIESISYAE